MSDDLVTNPCRQECRWRLAERRHDGERLFACTSCGSQWVRSQPWVPIDADGSRHPDLVAEVERHEGHS